MKEATAFNKPEIDGALRKQGISAIEKGDVVLFYTGWTKLIGKDNKRYNAGEPGLGVGGAKYLAGLGVVAVGADTWGVEAVPFEKDAGVFRAGQGQSWRAKAGLASLNQKWTEASAAFQSGNMTDAIAKGQAAKAKAVEAMTALNMPVPEAAK